MKMLYVNDFFTNSSSYSRRLDGKISIIIKFSPLTILIFRCRRCLCRKIFLTNLNCFLIIDLFVPDFMWIFYQIMWIFSMKWRFLKKST